MGAMIKPGTGAKYARILGVGAYSPSRVVTNEEMTTMIETTDEWIQQRTGIVERRWANPEETLLAMSAAACRDALKMAGVAPETVDAVIVATVSYGHQTPGLAPLLAVEVGAKGAAAYDISAACAGFCYGIAQADALIRSGAARHVLVIGAERLSDLTDTSDRSTAFIFADGAGAALVGPSETPGIGPVVWGSDGEQADAIHQTRDLYAAAEAGQRPYLVMDGRPVFRWATTFIADAAAKTLEAAGLTPDDLDVFIPHQANNRITDSMLRHLNLPEKVAVSRFITTSGNTSAASIPMAMADMLAKGEAKSGQTALIIGFGAGLVYAGQVVTLP